MPFQRKVFRIEQQMGPTAAAGAAIGNGAIPTSHCDEILAELKALHDLVERRMAAATPEIGQRDAADRRRYKVEAADLRDSMNRVNREIVALHAAVFTGPAPSRVSRELGAAADGAERATQSILDAAESIEDAARNLSASLKRKQEQALALDIQDHVLRIFEACNFQDLGGQRLAKVDAAMKALEERFAHILEIVRDSEASQDDCAAADGQGAPVVALHGPKLDHDHGHASQEEVDKLLAAG
jgi:chemotaxis protein CheZ